MPDGLVDAGLITAVADIAGEAGRMALDRFRTEYRRWEKEPGHPVCEVDIAVDQLLKQRLYALDPDAAWLSEETADNDARLSHDRVWVVDPIDGTRDYLRGRPGWCISIALVENGRPVIGVLDAPARNEQWRAVAGHGATRNGVALHASTRATLPGARVPAETLAKIDSDLVTVARPNSIALRIAMVAADEADLCASIRWGHEWDIAAAALIAQEAGATVTDAWGVPIGYNSPRGEAFGVLAAAAPLHTAAVARISERAHLASAR